MDNLPPYLQHIQSGALRALGVSSAKRWFAAPDVPTIAEQGYPGFDAAPWWYVAAPAGTPADIVQEAVGRDGQGQQVRGRDQEDPRGRRGRAARRCRRTLAKQIKTENVKWKKVVEAAKLEPQ